MTGPRLSVHIATSLDGCIADGNGSLDWLDAAGDPPEDYGFDDLLARVDLVAMGRSTYDFIEHVPELPYGDRPVHVFTTRDPGPRDGFEFYSRTPEEAVSTWEKAGVGLFHPITRATPLQCTMRRRSRAELLDFATSAPASGAAA